MSLTAFYNTGCVDFQHYPIEIMINRRFKGKVKAIENPQRVKVKEAPDLCSTRGFPVSGQAVEGALRRKRLKIDNQGSLEAGQLLTWAKWRTFNATFERFQLTPRELAKAVYRGFSFAPVYHSRRVKANFIAAHHLAADFDTLDHDSTFEGITAVYDRFFSFWGSFLYTSPSHKKETPKARAVFILEKPIANYEEYETLYRALLHIYTKADNKAKDALRLFFGSEGCQLEPNWALLTVAAQEAILAQYRQDKPQPPPLKTIKIAGGNYQKYVERAIANIERELGGAMPGNRHNTLYSCAASLGDLVLSSWANLSQNTALQIVKNCTYHWGDEGEVERVALDAFKNASPRPEPMKQITLYPT